jgi:hypothetical protein
VQPKDITFPTDAKLLRAAIKGLTRLARKIVYEYRWQAADGTWSSWRRTPDIGELDYPNEAREIQHRIAAAPACEAAN